MFIQVLKSKIHRAVVTAADLNYEGSITIDATMMIEARILEYERVQVLNINNGERIETYAIKGKPGEICLNGAAARKFIPGDVIIILSYKFIDPFTHYEDPILLFPNEKNKLIENK